VSLLDTFLERFTDVNLAVNQDESLPPTSPKELQTAMERPSGETPLADDDALFASPVKEDYSGGRHSVEVVVRSSRNGAETAGLDADPNHGRRKRAKMDSSHIKQGEILVESKDHGSSPSVEQAGRKENPTSMVALKEKSNEIGPVLKLNSRGTLGSPKKDLKRDQEPATKAVKAKSSPKSLITMMNYEGEEMKQKIGRILSGSGTSHPNQSPKKRVMKQTISPTNTAKPPHPFFSKKTQSQPEAGTSSIGGPPLTIEQKASRSPRALKSFSPLKLRSLGGSRPTGANSSSVGFGGFLPTHLTKNPGAKDAPWPWKGASHIRAISETLATDMGRVQKLEIALRKSKGSAVHVHPDEDIVSREAIQHSNYRNHNCPTLLRIPDRLILNGPQIQSRLMEELSSGLMISEQLKIPAKAVSSNSYGMKPHPAIFSLFLGIENTLTPFDINLCESRSWTQKYGPSSAAHVLQPGPEATIIHDWLLTHTIHHVDTGKRQYLSSSPRGSQTSSMKTKKKRRRADELDDFIVSESDDESGFGDFTDVEDDTSRPLPSERSQVRRGSATRRKAKSIPERTLNTVLLSGPNGSGKTAAVYAVAKELGFEVFEINSGSRRSGKDILDRIGDMTENHLVQQVSKALSAPSTQTTDDFASRGPTLDDGDNGRQGNMTAFFKPAIEKPSKPLKKGAVVKTERATNKAVKQQKQSLILFEEVDVLFQEDKQFWTTVLALAIHSKRPIILTCNDEIVVPRDALNLHAVLRFIAPPVDLAVDYLLLIAGREGHILRRVAVQSLYLFKNHDLRACINELQFYCQMGVGDDKGGMSWMIDRWPPGCDVDKYGHKNRAMSKDTYLTGMGWSDRDLNCSRGAGASEKEEELLSEATTVWNVSIDDLALRRGHPAVNASIADVVSLEAWLDFSENLSAADTFCRGVRTGLQLSLDPSHPLPSLKSTQSYTEDYPVLPAYRDADFVDFSTKLAVAITRRSRQLLTSADGTGILSAADCLDEQSFIEAILKNKSASQHNTEITRGSFSVMDPIAEDGPSHSGVILASSLDREFRVLVEEIAPYVRSISAYDLALEAERAQTLVSVKRRRTTRASRSALEGGRREEKRRERWFTKDMNLKQVMETGSAQWYQATSVSISAASPSTTTSSEDSRSTEV
jgi:DNA polymerase III delta prime subunit